MENLLFFGVPILKHIRVVRIFSVYHEKQFLKVRFDKSTEKKQTKKTKKQKKKKKKKKMK